MIFNHPSAYIYSNPRPSPSPSLATTAAMLAPHVGASEGPIWSPHLKSPVPISPLSNHLSSRVGGNSVVSPQEERNYRGQAIPRVRSRNTCLGAVEQRMSSSSPTSSSPSFSSSPCFSLYVPSEDEDEQASIREGRVGLEALTQEPPIPIPHSVKMKGVFVFQRR